MSTKIEAHKIFRKGKLQALDIYEIDCTWGMGADVSINLERNDLVRKAYPNPTFVPMDLTADEAEQMAKALLEAAAKAREWDKEYEAYERLRQGTDEVADANDFEGSGSPSKAVSEDTTKPL